MSFRLTTWNDNPPLFKSSMDTVFRLLAAFCLRACFFPNGASGWEPLRAHPQNPYILEFRGEPTVLHTYGEQYSSVINSAFDFVPYLNVLQRDGMNLTRTFLVGFRLLESDSAFSPLSPTPANFVQPWQRRNTQGNALDGLGKWDFSTWNEDYFARLNAFAQACSDRGIAIELTFFCTQYDSAHWQVSPFNPANNVQGLGPANPFGSLRPANAGLFATQEAVVRRIVREVNRFDHIYFEIANEPFWDEPGVKDTEEADFHNRMLAIIRSEESGLPNRHLVAHNYPQQLGALSNDFDVINEHYPAPVPTTPVAGAEALLRDHYSRGRILAFDETNTTSPTQSRLESWMFILGGGGIYSGLDVPDIVYTDQNESGDTAFGNASRGAIRNLATYLSTLDLVGLRRDLSWVGGGLPAGATLQAMSEPGQQYVAYLHHGKGGITDFQLSYNPIDSSNKDVSLVVTLPQGTWRAVWTRPVDLVELRTEVFTHSGGTRSLAALTYQEDVALRMDRIIDGPNIAPVAKADAYTAQQNMPLAVPAAGVLTNDTDAQHSPLTAVLDVAPTRGVLILDPDGGFTYVPAANYTGVDSFTYHANDGTLDSNRVIVTLTVAAFIAEPLVNGGFESGYNGWTWTGNQLIQVAPPYVIPEGINHVTFNSDQTVPNGILAQTFSTSPGRTYTVSFHIGVLSYNSSEQRMQVEVTGTTGLVSQTFPIVGASGGATRWLANSLAFTAAGNSATLTFRDRSPTTNALDLLLDNVRVSTPPAEVYPTVPTISGTPGNITIQMRATVPGFYFLESSEDIITWKRIDSIELSSPGLLTFFDPRIFDGSPTFKPRMFYRISTKSN
jgi:hypothetical protein